MTTNQRDQTRELEVCALYSGGETMQEIANRYGISRERIRQILFRNGLSGAGGHHTCVDPLLVLRTVAEAESVCDLARRLGYSPQQAGRVLRALKPQAIEEMAAYRHEACRTRLITRLRELGTRLGRKPLKQDFDAYLGGGTSYQEVFGSLSAACRAAGYAPLRSCHPHMTRAQQTEIALRFEPGHGGNCQALAREYGVTPNRIGQIVRSHRSAVLPR